MPAPPIDIDAIDDSGEFVPYARKHMTRSEGGRELQVLRLAEVWPEPNWAELVRQGRDRNLVAMFAMLYDAIPNRPHPDGTSELSGPRWESSYRQGIRLVKEFFDQATTVAQATQLKYWLARKFQATPKELDQRPKGSAMAFWAIAPFTGRRFFWPGSLSVRQSQQAKWMARLGWPESDAVLRTNVTLLQQQGGMWMVVTLSGNRYTVLQAGFASPDEALAFARTEVTRISAEAARAGKKGEARSSDRCGPDLATPESLDAEFVMKEFGLRALQFGESLGQAERRRWLLHVYEAFSDLARVTGLPRRWIGLGGIAVAAGARGKGSALAHYEPTLRVVNLTRAKGAGSLAHEWWHALDHRLAKAFNETSLVETLRKRHDPTRQMAPALEREARALIGRLGEGEFLRQAARIERLPRTRKGYWTTLSELSARAFEAWVEDQLRDAGEASPYLVHGTLPDADTSAETFAYPLESDRVQLGQVFGQLMYTLRSM